MQKSLARRIAALGQTPRRRRYFHFWDDQDGQVQLEIAAMKESGAIEDGDEVTLIENFVERKSSGRRRQALPLSA